jgi:hypothetical protein
MADSTPNTKPAQEQPQSANGLTPIAKVKTQKECTFSIPIDLTVDSGERSQEGCQSCKIRSEER